MTTHSSRGYQTEVIHGVEAAWAAGARNVMPVCPTGSGKTFIVAQLVERRGVPAWCVAHRAELVGQMSTALAREGIAHRIIGPDTLRRNCDDPETARDALAAMANVPGPIGADLIYEVWTATASRTTATDLARSLIYSKEVRAKASKSLAVALDLRDADTCEKNRDLLERATGDGDHRAFHLLNKLTRKYGCGPNKRQDCYACLRDGKDLDATLKIVKTRREPHPFGG